MPYRRILVALILTTFTDSLAEEFLNPLIVVNLEARGIPASLIGLAISSGDLGVLLAAPFVPGIIRRVDPLHYLRWTLLLLTGGVLLFPLFPHVFAWVALDFGMGVVTCGFFVLSDSLVNAASADAWRGKLLGVYLLSESLGAILGPALLSQVGFAGVAPWFVAAAFMLVGVAPWFLLGEAPVPALGRDAPPSLLGLARTAPLLLVVAVAGAFLEDMPASLLPVFAIDSGLAERTAVLLLSAMALGSIALQLPAGWAADVVERHRLLVLLSTATLVLCVPLAKGASEPWAIFPVVFLLGGLFNAYELVGLALLGERGTLQNLASLSAAATLFGGVASFAGPPLTGAAMDAVGPVGFVAAVACAAFAVLVAAAIGGHRRRRRLAAAPELRAGSS